MLLVGYETTRSLGGQGLVDRWDLITPRGDWGCRQNALVSLLVHRVLRRRGMWLSTRYSVDVLEPRLGEILAGGHYHVGDRHDVKRAIDEAALRPSSEIDSMLNDIATANALMASASAEPATTVPPASVFYVLPWLQYDTWEWGLPCELRSEVDGVAMTFGINGLRAG